MIMDFRNVPNRSEVLYWNSAQLADYFKKLSYKDCEKVVKKHNISGQRFLDMSENDIQKFPKLTVPIITKLSQEINRKEEKRGFFQKRAPTQRLPDNTEFGNEEEAGWSSFEEDEDDNDYESPDELHPDDGDDYESPTEEVQDGGSDNDYEPPPSNDEDAHHNVICPAKPIVSTSDYIDHCKPRKSINNPPVPPQRPGLPPGPSFGNRSTPQPPIPLSSNNDEPNRDRNIRTAKPLAPIIDRSKKPSLGCNSPQVCEREPPIGRKPPFPEKSFTLPASLPVMENPDETPRVPNPPLPIDRINSTLERRPPSTRPTWTPERRDEEIEGDIPQRPLPQPGVPPFSSNTLRSSKLPKPNSSGPSFMPVPNPDSLSPSASLPARFQQGVNINRSFSKGPTDNRPLFPPQNKRPIPPAPAEEECSLDEAWYVPDYNRTEAESALRSLNQLEEERTPHLFKYVDSAIQSVQLPEKEVAKYTKVLYIQNLNSHKKFCRISPEITYESYNQKYIFIL
nr:PREDICTED: lymphocyte cytosolic protein 2 [Latimeria chalumnae]|eukprot:XP_014347775.1 PREDICTED: lymphocyte cytosolic protein 2 [Latimeria chalumnae]